MAITIYNYDKLITAIKNLKDNYSIHKGRYYIADAQPSEYLDILIKRVNTHVLLSKTARTSEINLFSQLIKELIPYKDKGEDAKNNVTFLLLGTLIYRKLRLESTYAWYSFTANVKNCKLHQGIDDALDLGEKKKLDNLTIVTALEIFRDNMLRVNEKDQQPRFMTYELFAKDPVKFKSFLTEMINKYKIDKETKLLINEFKAIDFLQSLASELDNEKQVVQKILDEWFVTLEKQYKEFTQLDAQLMFEDFQNRYLSSDGSNSDSIKKINQKIVGFIGLLPDDLKGIAGFKACKSFLASCFENDYRCIIAGAYFILAKQAELREDFLDIIKSDKTLDLGILDSDEQKSCITLLDEFIKLNDKVDCTFFHGRKILLTELSNFTPELATNAFVN